MLTTVDFVSLYNCKSAFNGRPTISLVCKCMTISAVRDLGIMLDAEVTMSTHVSAVVKASFAALRRIRSVRRSIPRRALLTLIQALVVSKVDYTSPARVVRWLHHLGAMCSRA